MLSSGSDDDEGVPAGEEDPAKPRKKKKKKSPSKEASGCKEWMGMVHFPVDWMQTARGVQSRPDDVDGY